MLPSDFPSICIKVSIFPTVELFELPVLRLGVTVVVKQFVKTVNAKSLKVKTIVQIFAFRQSASRPQSILRRNQHILEQLNIALSLHMQSI